MLGSLVPAQTALYGLLTMKLVSCHTMAAVTRACRLAAKLHVLADLQLEVNLSNSRGAKCTGLHVLCGKGLSVCIYACTETSCSVQCMHFCFMCYIVHVMR